MEALHQPIHSVKIVFLPVVRLERPTYGHPGKPSLSRTGNVMDRKGIKTSIIV